MLLGISEKFNISEPHFVGGTVRDFIISKNILKIKDFDITTLNDDCSRLGLIFSVYKKAKYRIFPDKHVSVNTDFIGFDFSANMRYKNVLSWINESGLNVDFSESYSRDFTINSMHQNMSTEEVFDPTNYGIKDIQNKIIRTACLPEITLGNDKRRIFRAIKLAVQFGFQLDGSIIDWVRDNYSKDTSEDNFSRSAEINKAMLMDADMTYDIIKSMELQKKIPLIGPYKDYIIENNLVLNNI